MKGRNYLIFITGFLAVFFTAWYISARFGSATRAFISIDGTYATSNVPVHLWTVVIWPMACLIIGGLSAYTHNSRLSRPFTLLVAVLTGLGAIYGLASVIAFWRSIDGFFGILAYQGGFESSSPMKWSVYICPMAAPAGVLIFSLLKSLT